MNNKTQSMLRLAKKAGKITLGYDIAIENIKNKLSSLILYTYDLSDRTLKKLNQETEKYKIDIIKVDISMDEIYEILGKTSGVVSINDIGFAKKIRELLIENSLGGK